MQRTARRGGRFFPISFLGLAIIAAGLPGATTRGEEITAENGKAADTKPADEIQQQQKLIQEQMEAEQRALEKQLREDPAWQPTHAQVGVIRVGQKPKDDFVHSFCLTPEGSVLVGCGGKRQVVEMKGDKMAVHTETDPTELRTYTPEGDLQKTWKVDTEPQAIAMLPDGTIFVAGDGQLLKLDADGKVLAKAKMPSLAEEKPAG